MKTNDTYFQQYDPEQSKLQKKMPFIEPGTQCGTFESTMSTTVTN